MQESAVPEAIAQGFGVNSLERSAKRGSAVSNRFLAAKNRERPVSLLLSLFPLSQSVASSIQLHLLDSEAC
ncbi:hypothetical protein SAMD00079811_78820 (plasmid) [Scytonema sp. HK-05]|nr:hypothetical protein SAMD00079811_78820 [Scytonema sp. HK-05]